MLGGEEAAAGTRFAAQGNPTADFEGEAFEGTAGRPNTFSAIESAGGDGVLSGASLATRWRSY